MKEVEPSGTSSSESPSTSASSNPNGKTAKDLKGLVYQGGSNGETPPEESDSIVDEPITKTSGTKGAGKEFDIMNFSEEEHSNNKLIIGTVAIIAIIGIAYFVFSSSHISLLGGGKGSTTIPISHSTLSTATSTSGTTSTIAPTNLNIMIQGINLFYNYTGPKNVSGNRCTAAYTKVDSQTFSANTPTSFTYSIPSISSSGCPVHINKIYITTPGFKMVSIVPSPPLFLPPNSNEKIVMTFTEPPANFIGPISLTINEN